MVLEELALDGTAEGPGVLVVDNDVQRLAKRLELTTVELESHLKKLADAGLLEFRPEHSAGRPHRWHLHIPEGLSTTAQSPEVAPHPGASLQSDPDLLARQTERRVQAEQWEIQRVARDRLHVEWQAREARRDGWQEAISAALNDNDLTLAIQKTTRPVPVIDRRSVPAVTARLVAWAIGVHRHAPDRPLGLALGTDLTGPPTPPASLAEGIPFPPGVPEGAAPADLRGRVTDLLAHRPELAGPQVHKKEPRAPRRGPDRGLAPEFGP